MEKEFSSRYQQRGVSASKAEVHQAIARLDKGLFPDTFCKILPDIAGGDKSYCNIMHADTAGTKTSLAYIYWKETGELDIWKGIVQDAVVMNLDDIACTGITSNIIFSSTIGRNKNKIPGEVLNVLIEGTATLLDKLNSLGLSVFLAGGETADVGDIVRTVDVGFTAFVRAPVRDILRIQIQPGDVIIGLSSAGKAAYESGYNSGIGSNGLTNARHDVLHHVYAEKYPEAYDPEIPEHLAFCGNYRIDDVDKESGMTVGQLLLSPTRTYAPLIHALPGSLRRNIHGIIHCTGGGQTKVLKFVNHLHIIKDNMFPLPPVFRLIKNQSGADWKEMYAVFNMGHRMEIYCEPSAANDIINLAESFGIGAQIVGRCEEFRGKKLTIKTPGGMVEYA